MAKELTQREITRRKQCRDRARFMLLGWHNNRRKFDDVYARILRRWPVIAAGAEFKVLLLTLWMKEDRICNPDRRGPVPDEILERQLARLGLSGLPPWVPRKTFADFPRPRRR